MKNIGKLAAPVTAIGCILWFITSLFENSNTIPFQMLTILGISLFTNSIAGACILFTLLTVFIVNNQTVNNILVPIMLIIMLVRAVMIIRNRAGARITSAGIRTSGNPLLVKPEDYNDDDFKDAVSQLERGVGKLHNGFIQKTLIIINSIIMISILFVFLIVLIGITLGHIGFFETLTINLVRVITIPAVMLTGHADWLAYNTDEYGSTVVNMILGNPVMLIVSMFTIWVCYLIPCFIISMASSVMKNTDSEKHSGLSRFMCLIDAPGEWWRSMLTGVFARVFRSKLIHWGIIIAFILIMILNLIMMGVISPFGIFEKAPRVVRWGNQYAHGFRVAGGSMAGLDTGLGLLGFIFILAFIACLLIVCSSWLIVSLPYYAPAVLIITRSGMIISNNSFMLVTVISGVVGVMLLTWLPAYITYCHNATQCEDSLKAGSYEEVLSIPSTRLNLVKWWPLIPPYMMINRSNDTSTSQESK